ncbi:MAG: glycosyltransferase family 4 protein [Treponema sp.]|nr:glycosyltransferase family 4 protein [Treponema sp.]
MKKILIDLTYILDENDLQKSTALYVQRFLDNLEETCFQNYSFILFVRKATYLYFKNKYENCAYSFIVFNELKHIHISFIKSILDAKKWQRQVNAISCDVVYVPFTWVYNALRINKRKVITIHDLRPIRETRIRSCKKIVLGLFRYYFKIAVKNADLVIAISDFVKNDIIREFKCLDKVKVVYNGIPIQTKLSEISQLVNKKYILYVNTLTPYKNVLTLVKAFSMLDNSNLLLVIVGKETSYWKEKCLPESTDKVVRLDYVTDSELTWLYRNAELFVTTSIHEGFGFTPIEAAIQCCPVISTKADSLPEVTKGAVYYYEPFDDCNALCVQINRVLKERDENPERFDEKIKAVSKIFKEAYSLSAFKENILKLLEG